MPNEPADGRVWNLPTSPAAPAGPLLTIVVPTYNRAERLRLLLETLREETAPVAADVIVHVYDNHSADDTPNVVASMAADWPGLQAHRHDGNVGAERNFFHGVRAVRTRWFWIIGDDDLPKHGVIAQIVALLRTRAPALVYMESEWLADIHHAGMGQPVGSLRVATLDALKFASTVHVWVTFISGMVIDCERLRVALGPHSIERFVGSQVGQLAWVLPMLQTTGPFLFVSDRCVLASKDNSGGYGPLTVFGANFTRVVNETFGAGSPLARAMIGANVIHYIPGVIWTGRRKSAPGTSYVQESPWPELRRQLGSRWMYWLLLVPLGKFPRWAAQPFFQAWRVSNFLRRNWRQRFGVVGNEGLGQ